MWAWGGSSWCLASSWRLKQNCCSCLVDAEPVQKKRWLQNSVDGLEDEMDSDLGWKITGEMESLCREDDGVPLRFWMDKEMKWQEDGNGNDMMR